MPTPSSLIHKRRLIAHSFQFNGKIFLFIFSFFSLNRYYLYIYISPSAFKFEFEKIKTTCFFIHQFIPTTRLRFYLFQKLLSLKKGLIFYLIMFNKQLNIINGYFSCEVLIKDQSEKLSIL